MFFVVAKEMTYSARRYRRPENIMVIPVVVSELKFINVEMEILLTDLVEGANDPAFHDGPEAFDDVGMHRANDIVGPARD